MGHLTMAEEKHANVLSRANMIYLRDAFNFFCQGRGVQARVFNDPKIREVVLEARGRQITAESLQQIIQTLGVDVRLAKCQELVARYGDSEENISFEVSCQLSKQWQQWDVWLYAFAAAQLSSSACAF